MQLEDLKAGHYLLTDSNSTNIIFVGYDEDGNWLFHILGKAGRYTIEPDGTILEVRLASNGYTYEMYSTSWSITNIHPLPLEISYGNIYVSLPEHKDDGAIVVNGLSISPEEALTLMAILESQEIRLRALAKGKNLKDIDIYIEEIES